MRVPHSGRCCQGGVVAFAFVSRHHCSPGSKRMRVPHPGRCCQGGVVVFVSGRRCSPDPNECGCPILAGVARVGSLFCFCIRAPLQSGSKRMRVPHPGRCCQGGVVVLLLYPDAAAVGIQTNAGAPSWPVLPGWGRCFCIGTSLPPGIQTNAGTPSWPVLPGWGCCSCCCIRARLQSCRKPSKKRRASAPEASHWLG